MMWQYLSATASGPGPIHDANDRSQFLELDVLGELTEIAWRHNVQVSH